MSSSSRIKKNSDRALKQIYINTCTEHGFSKPNRRLTCNLLQQCSLIDQRVLRRRFSNAVSRIVQLKLAHEDGVVNTECSNTPYDAAIATFNADIIQHICETRELDTFRAGLRKIVNDELSVFDPRLVRKYSSDSLIEMWVTSATLDFDGKIIDQMLWPKVANSIALKRLKMLIEDRNRFLKRRQKWHAAHSPPRIVNSFQTIDEKSHLPADIQFVIGAVLNEWQALEAKLGLPPKGSDRLNPTLRFVIEACTFVLGDRCPPNNKISNFAHKWRKNHVELFGWEDESQSSESS